MRWRLSARRAQARATGRSAEGWSSRLGGRDVSRPGARGRRGEHQRGGADENNPNGNGRWNRRKDEQRCIHPPRERMRELYVRMVGRLVRRPHRHGSLVMQPRGPFRHVCNAMDVIGVGMLACLVMRVPVRVRQAGGGNPHQHGDRQTGETRNERAVHGSNVCRDHRQGNTGTLPFHGEYGNVTVLLDTGPSWSITSARLTAGASPGSMPGRHTMRSCTRPTRCRPCGTITQPAASKRVQRLATGS